MRRCDRGTRHRGKTSSKLGRLVHGDYSLRSERYSPGPLRLSSFLDSASNLYLDADKETICTRGFRKPRTLKYRSFTEEEEERRIIMMTKIRESRMSDFSCEKTKVCMDT